MQRGAPRPLSTPTRSRTLTDTAGALRSRGGAGAVGEEGGLRVFVGLRIVKRGSCAVVRAPLPASRTVRSADAYGRPRLALAGCAARRAPRALGARRPGGPISNRRSSPVHDQRSGGDGRLVDRGSSFAAAQQACASPSHQSPGRKRRQYLNLGISPLLFGLRVSIPSSVDGRIEACGEVLGPW